MAETRQPGSSARRRPPTPERPPTSGRQPGPERPPTPGRPPGPECAAGHEASPVPDILAPQLRVVFCGINPGRRSEAAGAHFANPRNDFWRLLHAAGFTPHLLSPQEQDTLPSFGIGITNAAGRATRGSSDLRGADFAGSAERLARLADGLRPRAIGFVGKEAYRGPFRERPEHGLQERRLGDTLLFVLPSTSPANAAVSWDDRLHWFRALRGLVP
jgi:double-stranded uracil-DNA glycosylase